MIRAASLIPQAAAAAFFFKEQMGKKKKHCRTGVVFDDNYKREHTFNASSAQNLPVTLNGLSHVNLSAIPTNRHELQLTREETRAQG